VPYDARCTEYLYKNAPLSTITNSRTMSVVSNHIDYIIPNTGEGRVISFQVIGKIESAELVIDGNIISTCTPCEDEFTIEEGQTKPIIDLDFLGKDVPLYIHLIKKPVLVVLHPFSTVESNSNDYPSLRLKKCDPSAMPLGNDFLFKQAIVRTVADIELLYLVYSQGGVRFEECPENTELIPYDRAKSKWRVTVKEDGSVDMTDEEMARLLADFS